MTPFLDRFRFIPGVLVIILLLSACQSPHGDSTDHALSSSSVICDGRMAWSAEIWTEDLIDYSTFWIAFEAATAQDSLKYIQVNVTLDGKPLSQEMKYVQAAEPYLVTCTDTDQQFEASRLKYTLFLPALSSGEHLLVWKYTLTADLQDGEFRYPSGMTSEYEIKLDITG